MMIDCGDNDRIPEKDKTVISHSHIFAHPYDFILAETHSIINFAERKNTDADSSDPENIDNHTPLIIT